jgi:hypothetical protein
MRMRVVKPEFWKDELVAKWTPLTRLAYIGLWSEADDFGRLRWIPEYLRAAIFPYDVRMNMEAALKPIVDSRRVFLYSVNGTEYAVILSFHKHQRINRKSKPQLPDPPREALAAFIEESLKAQCGLTECSVSVHQFFDEHAVRTQEPSRARADQGSGIREQGTGSREQVASAEGFFHSLKETGKFPELTMEGLVTVVQQHHPDSSPAEWDLVRVEAENMPGCIGNPMVWLSKALGRLLVEKSGQKKNAAAQGRERIEDRKARGPEAEIPPPPEFRP